MNEFSLIKNFFSPLVDKEALNLEDDAAIIQSLKNDDFVISTDTLVEKIHFFGTEKPELIAKKSLRVNLSDLAAMGAEPLYYNLSISIPPKKSRSFIKAFSKGLELDQNLFDVRLIGGDLTSSKDVIVITISIIGKVPSGKFVSRRGARNGDFLFVTGILGASKLGLNNFDKKSKNYDFVKKRYLLPEPRINFGLKVRDYANSMIDISDGLIQDAGHLARLSNLELDLDFRNIPLTKIKHVSYKKILNAALYGGDDYELLFSSSPNNEKKLFQIANDLGLNLSKIGKFRKGAAGKIFYNTKEVKNESYMHF